MSKLGVFLTKVTGYNDTLNYGMQLAKISRGVAFCYILDRFCFALRLIQAPNKRAGYQLVASKTIHYTMMM